MCLELGRPPGRLAFFFSVSGNPFLHTHRCFSLPGPPAQPVQAHPRAGSPADVRNSFGFRLPGWRWRGDLESTWCGGVRQETTWCGPTIGGLAI